MGNRSRRRALGPEVTPAIAPADPLVAGLGTRQAYTRFVLVVGALIALGPLTIDMYLPAFPRISDELNASEAQMRYGVGHMHGAIVVVTRTS